MRLMLLFYVQLILGLAIAAIFGVGFYRLWDWLAPREADAPAANSGKPDKHPADQEA